jgi:prepilin-type processing-associated H-X9-DG protein
MSQTPTTDKPRLSGQALAALLLGLASVTLATAPLALYFGFRGLYAVNASDGRLLGRRMAIIGMALGAVGTVVLIIGSVALLLLKMRSVSERVECENNLRVVGVAVLQYHENNDKVFPRAVVPLDSEPPDRRASWHAAVLPYLDAGTGGTTKWQTLAGRLDLTKPWDDSANGVALNTYVPFYQCRGDPAFDPRGRPGVTNYVGVAGVGDDAAALPQGHPRAGFFGYDRTLTLADLKPLVDEDKTKATGTGYKLMVVETMVHVGPWIAGGPPTVRGVGFDPTFLSEQGVTVVGMAPPPAGEWAAAGATLVPRPPEPSLIGPGRPFGGLHPGGMNVLWVDGSVRFVADSFPPRTFRQQAVLSNDPDVLATLP